MPANVSFFLHTTVSIGTDLFIVTITDWNVGTLYRRPKKKHWKSWMTNLGGSVPAGYSTVTFPAHLGLPVLKLEGLRYRQR